VVEGFLSLPHAVSARAPMNRVVKMVFMGGDTTALHRDGLESRLPILLL
jgi:hypothetical protein